jgi:hypothetical protein
MNGQYLGFLLISALPGIIFLSCKDKDAKLNSRWKNAEIVVDGDAADWSGSLTYWEKEKLALGVQNDESYLYLCLQPDRQTQRRAMMFGFTIWLDSTAQDKKILGIRFPIGMQNYEDEWTPDFGPQGEEGLDGPPQRNEGGFEGQQRFAEMLSEIAIIGPDKDDRNRIPVNNTYGIKVAITEFSSEPVYELKVPLHVLKGQPYVIAAAAGETISLGLELGELDREKMREQMMGRGGFGGGRPGGGIGGGRPGGGMGGGRRPGGFGGNRPEMPKPLKVWTKVQLASN